MDYDVRCTKLQARIVAGLLEVKCDSRICKQGHTNAVVLHYFSLLDGKLLETKRFRNPPVASTEEVNR